MPDFVLGQWRISWTLPLALGYLGYLLLGATVFQLLEKQAEAQSRVQFQIEKLQFLENYTCLDRQALEQFVQVIMEAWVKGVNPKGNSTNPSNWDFSNSFFFAGTVVTTIGYGNLAPSTGAGQVFCIFYALFGVPLNLTFLNHLGKGLSAHLALLDTWGHQTGRSRVLRTLALLVFLAAGTLLFLVFPPMIFSSVEGWSFGEGFYFAFITLSTIGFGDYVVGTDPNKHYISVYRSLAAVWIICGLAWLALVFNLASSLVEKFLQLHLDGAERGPPEQVEEALRKRQEQPGRNKIRHVPSPADAAEQRHGIPKPKESREVTRSGPPPLASEP
ncbi:potassium channel subfamily K member 16 [Ornithorhynchus anatinus]|uniref:potassium channel subfamily K member 16 n=1 Tax=Ornithorhynchus anatinus TaxID=9258 RepID=UPI00022401F0|nr:potassium channel subfamily K member 16 [Ornithorhynchus anatinus]